jgi:hypothetical protein
MSYVFNKYKDTEFFMREELTFLKETKLDSPSRKFISDYIFEITFIDSLFNNFPVHLTLPSCDL